MIKATDVISDEQLAAMAQQGDKAAMELLMSKYASIAGVVARSFRISL